ncbi:MAG TPA: PQQ-dependent dehydrogenase, methanol/ethanol family [Longimicrobiales bacterium]|nr:PQQ-dependent dehydrogenase, methanol/ethanol family [Longimicrobiales bacterium]
MRSARNLQVLGSIVAFVLSSGCAREDDAPSVPTGDAPAVRSAGDWPEDGQWAMPAKDYANTRYSALSEIDTSNVAGLRPVWSFTTGVLRGHEGQPLVIDNTMYVVTPFPHIAYAFDLTQEGYPLKWKYTPDVNPAAIGVACCDIVNRGPAYADGRLIYNLLDAHTVALDAETGRELWKVRTGDINLGETTTMAPIIVDGKAIVGNSGGEFGVRGWIAALDVETGEEVWRGWSTGPDTDVLIDIATFRPFYERARGRDLGVTTWPADQWKIGGGTVWLWLSYDPELDLIYYGTGNPSPFNPEQRPGDNKWTTSIMARRSTDGSLIWAYQQTPHDNWDFDGTNENILVDLPFRDSVRKLLVHFDRNGFAYTMDRVTGEVLVAEPYVHTNVATGFDLATGVIDYVAEKQTGGTGPTYDFCPSHYGGKDQQPAAYSPRTQLFYVPTNNMCEDWETFEVSYIAGTPYYGMSGTLHPGPGGHLGEFIAWDAVAGRKVWGIEEPYPVWGGGLATGGDVVFYGTLDGWFKAVSARDGRLLWRYKVGSGVVGNPITYVGPDGRQYVAIYAGIGGVWFNDVAHGAEPHNVPQPSAIVKDLGRHTSWGGMVWVFAL